MAQRPQPVTWVVSGVLRANTSHMGLCSPGQWVCPRPASVLTCVRAWAHAYFHMCTHMNTHICSRTCTCAYTCTQRWGHIHMLTYTHMRTHAHADVDPSCAQTRAHADMDPSCAHTHVHTDADMCSHMHTCTHVQSYGNGDAHVCPCAHTHVQGPLSPVEAKPMSGTVTVEAASCVRRVRGLLR